MQAERIQTIITPPLSRAYVERSDDALTALFGSHPGNPGDWLARAAELEREGRFAADPRQVAAVLNAYNKRIGGSDRAAAQIDRLAGGALAVVGGQQAGLFTGPVMVIHKAISIIQAAKAAERDTGRQVVPVFWIAGEDHDWPEANHAYVVSEEAGLRRIAVERSEHPRTSVSRTQLEPGRLAQAVRELAAGLPDTEHKPALLDRIEAAAGRSGTLTDLFAGLMAALFADEGLVLMDADDPALRALEGPMFRRIIAEQEVLADAYASASEKVRKLGYALQAEATPGSANLFVYRDARFGGVDPGVLAGERIMLYQQGACFTDKRGMFEVERDRLEQLALEAPELFSNNVLTRPLMQDYMLPVLATVLGPGEIAYWAQVGEAFRAFGMSMPIVVPRMSYTVTDEATRKRMKAFGLALEDVNTRLAACKEEWLARQDGASIDRLFAEVTEKFAALYDPLLAELTASDAGLGPIGEKNKTKIAEQIRYLESKAKEAHRRRYDADLKRFDTIAHWLAPEGQPQERVLNFAAMWNAHGRLWLERLLEAPFDPCGGHYRIDL